MDYSTKLQQIKDEWNRFQAEIKGDLAAPTTRPLNATSKMYWQEQVQLKHNHRSSVVVAAAAASFPLLRPRSTVITPALARAPLSRANIKMNATNQAVSAITQGLANLIIHTNTEIQPKQNEKKQEKIIRAGGRSWEDPTPLEWDVNDFRMFCADLGSDVTDEMLTEVFSKYSSFRKAKVVRDKRTKKSTGYGFVSFKDPQDYSKALKEMNNRYIGSRPIKLHKSNWKQRNLEIVRQKEKQKQELVRFSTGRSN